MTTWGAVASGCCGDEKIVPVHPEIAQSASRATLEQTKSIPIKSQ